MGQFDLLRYVVGVIEALGLRYFITGSTATIFYGEPRFTNDIDVVLDLPEQRVAEFCQRFPDEQFYVSLIAAQDAVRRRGQFNIIHPDSGLKLDVIVPEPSAFNESRFARSRRVHPGSDFEAWFASPEDAIIKKLEYYRDGGSEKHLRDIASVIKTSSATIDTVYISHWAHKMGLEEIWIALQNRMSEPK
jgi:hypothetical protein